MANDDLEYRLNELAARLARVERRVGIFPPEAVPGEQAPSEAPERSAPSDVEAIAPGAMAEVPAEPVGPEAAEPPPVEAPPASPPTSPSPIPDIDPEPPPPFRPRVIPAGLLGRVPQKARARADAFSTESLIGGRWFMVAGAMVVVVGILLLLKQAYDAGWFGLLTPGMKCLAAAGFGAVLLVLGDIARRKINAAASAGLSGAGVATLYASTYAAYGLYHLLGPTVAFGLLAVVSAVGIAVAVRAGLFSVAALAIAGSYLTPLLLNDAPSGTLVLPAYLLAILGVGLWLSAWRRVPFRGLRALVWWGTMIYGGLWTLTGDGSDQPLVALAFLGLVWGAVHLELTVSARRGAIGDVLPARSGLVVYRVIRPLLTSFSSSAWGAVLGVLVVRTSGLHLPEWLPPAAGTVGAGVLAGLLAGNLRVLRDRPRNDAQRLGAALAMQAGALLIAAVALGFADWLEVVAWLALGSAAVGAGRWIGGRALTVYGLIVLAIGAGRLLTVDWWMTGLAEHGVEFAWLYLSRWTGLVGAAGAAWLAAAWFIRAPRGAGLGAGLADADAATERREDRAWWPVGHACIGLGLTLLGVALVHERALTTPVAVVFAGLAVVAVFVARGVRSEGLMMYALALLAAATAWMGLADWRLLSSDARAVNVGGLILTRWSMGMALTSLLWFAAWRLVRRWAMDVGGEWATAPRLLLGVAITVLFSSLLHPGGSSASESVVGLVLGLALVWVARRSRSPAMAWYSLVVLGLVTVWLLLFEWGTVGTAASARGAAGLVFSRWTGLMVLIGTAWIVAGRSVGAAIGRWSPLVRIGGTGLGVALIFASLLNGKAEASSVCVAWLVMSGVVLAANRLDPRAGLDRLGLGALGMTVGAWVAAFPADWFSWSSPPALHPGLLMALAIVAVAGAAWRLRRVLRAEFTPVRVTAVVLACASMALIFAATSLEVARVAGDWASDERARKAAVSIWWGLFAITMVAGGFWKRWPACRYAGLGLLAVATAKALIYDLADITPPWRVASLLGLGMLMMGVAIGYSRVSQHIERARRAEELDPGGSADGRDKSGMPTEPG